MLNRLLKDARKEKLPAGGSAVLELSEQHISLPSEAFSEFRVSGITSIPYFSEIVTTDGEQATLAEINRSLPDR